MRFQIKTFFLKEIACTFTVFVIFRAIQYFCSLIMQDSVDKVNNAIYRMNHYPLDRVVSFCIGSQGNTRVYRGLLGNTRVYKGLHKGIQGFTGDNKGIQGRVYKGLLRYTRVYGGLQGYTRVKRG